MIQIKSFSALTLLVQFGWASGRTFGL